MLEGMSANENASERVFLDHFRANENNNYRKHIDEYFLHRILSHVRFCDYPVIW